MSFDLKQYADLCGAADPEDFSVRAEKLRAIVLEVNRSFNLTRITDPEEFMIKHVADSLAIGRTEQTVKEGWAAKRRAIKHSKY